MVICDVSDEGFSPHPGTVIIYSILQSVIIHSILVITCSGVSYNPVILLLWPLIGWHVLEIMAIIQT